MATTTQRSSLSASPEHRYANIRSPPLRIPGRRSAVGHSAPAEQNGPDLRSEKRFCAILGGRTIMQPVTFKDGIARRVRSETKEREGPGKGGHAAPPAQRVYNPGSHLPLQSTGIRFYNDLRTSGERLSTQKSPWKRNLVDEVVDQEITPLSTLYSLQRESQSAQTLPGDPSGEAGNGRVPERKAGRYPDFLSPGPQTHRTVL